MKEHNVQLRELAERFRRRGYTSTAILLEADAWIAEYPEDSQFRVPKKEQAAA